MKQIKGNATKARLVVALMSGGVVDMSWAKVRAAISVTRTYLPANQVMTVGHAISILQRYGHLRNYTVFTGMWAVGEGTGML